ncbi:hypothetical protein SPF06_04860 [Sinomonas sp. JGH33]|uniref:Uncharacterized protein n=1 Tax=Sinomonas terricola TaxID=3110330 RepID=A0ABU5T306_9MICC|nr:hypothetical protein [Sinomonas sp. JGH33]MEA5454048.1 hypothetical protein [Sinomonas sp. JGH33]
MGNSRTSPRQYWFGLSLVYGLSLSILALATPVWLFVFIPAAILFIVLQAVYYGQIGRNIQGRLATATPGVGVLATTGGAIAVLLRGSDAAYWAGPLLALAGFVAMFLFLSRFGRFHPNSSREMPT